MTLEQRDALEQILDATSTQDVVTGLSEICLLKAEHMRSNWQDERTAQAWERNGNRLNKILIVNTY